MQTKSFGMEKASLSGRLDFLDGLRALAAIWVVLGHCRLFIFGWDYNYSGTIFAASVNLLLYLHLAVDIFLVLSGFCLAIPVLRNGGRLPKGAGAYLSGRAWRILPPYYGVLFLILAINFFIPVIKWSRVDSGLTPDIPISIILANVFLLQDVMPAHNAINGPFWSIATEWHLYFIFPLLLPLLRRFGGIGVMVMCSILAAMLTRWAMYRPVIFADPLVMVPSPPYYIALFGAGIAAAYFYYRFIETESRWIERIAFASAFIVSIPFFYFVWKYRILNAETVNQFNSKLYVIDPLCGFLTAALLVAVAVQKNTSLVKRLFEFRPLVAIGHFSYSFYLIHIPLLSMAYRALEVSGLLEYSKVLSFILLSLGGGGICLMSAKAFAYIFEVRREVTLGRIRSFYRRAWA